VAQSWLRSLAGGVDPDRGGAQTSAVELARMREDHPLAPALPVIRRLLVEGDHKACRKAEAMNFVPGADWSERGSRTNAAGTALPLDSELQIRGSEHFSRVVQPWSCTAVPVDGRPCAA
jgi:hypothetical protein